MGMVQEVIYRITCQLLAKESLTTMTLIVLSITSKTEETLVQVVVLQGPLKKRVANFKISGHLVSHSKCIKERDSTLFQWTSQVQEVQLVAAQKVLVARVVPRPKLVKSIEEQEQRKRRPKCKEACRVKYRTVTQLDYHHRLQLGL